MAERLEKERIAAVVHLDFVAEIARDQIAEGRYFLFEHPQGASSWGEDSIERLSRHPDVMKVVAHQCQFGAEIQAGPHKGEPIMKPTGFLTNSPELAKALNRQCNGRDGQCSRKKGGKHVHLSGAHARRAAQYPSDLCHAVIHGMHKQLEADGHMAPGHIGMIASEDPIMDVDAVADPRCSGQYRDNITGQLLRDDLIREARLKELQYFRDKGVWAKVPKAEARRHTGREPISVRWVDVNKGDDDAPRYRSRLVARQLKCMDSSNTSYFAPAPPLEALRSVLSLASTEIGDNVPNWAPRSEDRTQILLLDISRAYMLSLIHI